MKTDQKHKKNKKRSKNKIKLEADQRPLTSDLTGYKSLQTRLSRIENQPHPLDRSNPFKIYFFCYVWPIVSLAKRAIVTQNAHYKLPRKDRISSAKVRLANGLYGTPIPEWSKRGEEPPEVEDPHSETKYPRELRTSILRAFFSRYVWKTTYIILFYILAEIHKFVKIYATKEVLELIDSELNHLGHLEDKQAILSWFLVIWYCNVFQQATYSFLSKDRSRLNIRITGGLYSIVYGKLLRIGVINYHEHDEGSIINYLQNDVTKFEDASVAIQKMITCSMNLVLVIIMGIVFFNWVFMVLVVGMLILCWVNSAIMKRWFRAENNWAKAVDVRLNLLKNVLRNVRFIKIGAFENIFLKKINEKRAVEVVFLIKSNIYFACLFFVWMIGNASIIISFLFCYFWSGLVLDVGSVTILLRIFDLLQSALFGIPESITMITDVFVSMRRLTLFLESKEIEFDKVKQEPNHKSLYAAEIKDGCFYWDKRVSQEESEQILDEEKNKKELKAKDKGDDVMVTASSELRKTLLTTATEEVEVAEGAQKASDDRFTFEDLNFRAERGKLTVIIGKIGSGKSSILYSLLGEMRVADFNKTKVHLNGSVSYLGQNPWIFNGTIKENILLDKDFDQEAFDFAIKYSALEDDIKIWEDGVEKMVGESGASISGGQKARVALARCLYQR